MTRSVKVMVSVMLVMIIAVSGIFIVSIERTAAAAGGGEYYGRGYEAAAHPADAAELTAESAGNALAAISGVRDIWIVQMGFIMLLSLLSLLFVNYGSTPAGGAKNAGGTSGGQSLHGTGETAERPSRRPVQK